MTLEQKLLALKAVLEDAAPILDRPLLEHGVSDPGAILREAARRLLVTDLLSGGEHGAARTSA